MMKASFGFDSKHITLSSTHLEAYTVDMTDNVLESVKIQSDAAKEVAFATYRVPAIEATKRSKHRTFQIVFIPALIIITIMWLCYKTAFSPSIVYAAIITVGGLGGIWRGPELIKAWKGKSATNDR